MAVVRMMLIKLAKERTATVDWVEGGGAGISLVCDSFHLNPTCNLWQMQRVNH